MAELKAVPEAKPDPKLGTQRRVSGLTSPYFNLADSLEVAQVMYENAGGQCDRAQLSGLLGYKGVKNGAFLSRVTAAKTFGLVAQDEDGDRLLRVTDRARAIIAPVTPNDAERAKVESFLSVELFRRVYEEYKEGTLPSEVGLRNLLETRYQVLKDRAGPAVKIMKESAAEAGFFRVSSDRMVKPILSGKGTAHATPEARHDHGPEQKPRHGGGSGGDGSGPDTSTIHPAILGLLKELPAAGTAMTKRKRDALISAFTATVGFIYPEIEENGSGGS
jgi:hypothetical protein